MNLPKEWAGLSAVYCIRNTVNGKEYIGSSRNVRNRMHRQRTLLRTNSHYSKRMQESWNKHGEENFISFILESCGEDRIEREQYYIDKLKPVFNTMSAVNPGPTPEMIKQATATRQKRFDNGTLTANCSKATSLYDLDGNLLYTEESKKKLAIKSKIPFSVIHRMVSEPYLVTEKYPYIVMFGTQSKVKPFWEVCPYYIVTSNKGTFKVIHLHHLMVFHGFTRNSITRVKNLINKERDHKMVQYNVQLITPTK